ncbi:MAG: hypothetical protein HY438_02805 [DPANN group archaeon]|nr:hypothetical protein [DPANN group archaeon]
MEKWVAYVLISVVAAVIIILLVFSGLLPKALNAASGQLKAPSQFLPV